MVNRRVALQRVGWLERDVNASKLKMAIETTG